jgi:type IV secretion system protein VirB10
MADQKDTNYFVPDFGDGEAGKAKKVKNSPKSARIIWIITGSLAIVMGIIVFSMSNTRQKEAQETESAQSAQTAPPTAAEVQPAFGAFSDSEAVREMIYRNMREQIVQETLSSDVMSVVTPPVAPVIDAEELGRKKNVRVVRKPPSDALAASRQMAADAFKSAPSVKIGGPEAGGSQAKTGAPASAPSDTMDELLSSYSNALSGLTETEGAVPPALASAPSPAAGGSAIAQRSERTADPNAGAVAHQDRANAYVAANTGVGGSGAAAEYLSSTRRAPLSVYELNAGSVISGVMIGGINSDLPGTILGQVTQNVYDTATGAHILIPQGARLVGAYDSHVVYGQNRLLVVWNRIIFPDGTSLNLEGMLGSDQRGYAGFKQKTDNHYSRMIGAAIFASVFVAAGKEATKDDEGSSGDDDDRSSKSIFAESVMENVTNIATEMLEKNMNVAPTLRILPGYRFSIITTKDVTFAEPYAVPGDR